MRKAGPSSLSTAEKSMRKTYRLVTICNEAENGKRTVESESYYGIVL